MAIREREREKTNSEAESLTKTGHSFFSGFAGGVPSAGGTAGAWRDRRAVWNLSMAVVRRDSYEWSGMGEPVAKHC